jgi:hypothetical protein
MREVLSAFQHILAPDEEVIKAQWFQPERENGLPTQRQRVKYAIIGAEQQDMVADEDVKLIDKLMKNARDRYEDLNRIEHARNREAKEDFPLLESYIESCQINMTKILELRVKLFRKQHKS